jgi:hypothetical protein
MHPNAGRARRTAKRARKLFVVIENKPSKPDDFAGCGRNLRERSLDQLQILVSRNYLL